MPRRRLSRYSRHRRLRLLRKSQRRIKSRRVFILVAVLILALPLMVIPAFAAESVGNLPAVDGLSASGLNQDMLIFDRHGTLIDDIGDQLRTKEVLEAVRALSPRHRAVVALRYGADLSYRQIGQALGISEAAALMATRRALAKLRKRLSQGVYPQ